jgi:hypothetical protein
MRPEAVAFARRPGTFAQVIDCAAGRVRARMEAPAGRHFYGHGVFSRDGQWLFTTENDYEAGAGRVGVWDASAGYIRVDEFASGGVGPHDIKRLPGGDILVVANGGIETHPDAGRSKLNIPLMRPTLSYLDGGVVIEEVTLAPELHKNSIRHLAVSEAGEVAFGMQWQGAAGEVVPLVGLHRLGRAVRLAQAPEGQLRDMQGYIGSVAFARDGRRVAATSPRGGLVQIYEDGVLAAQIEAEDASGIVRFGAGFLASAGTGELMTLAGGVTAGLGRADLQWDNHLVAV